MGSIISIIGVISIICALIFFSCTAWHKDTDYPAQILTLSDIPEKHGALSPQQAAHKGWMHPRNQSFKSQALREYKGDINKVTLQSLIFVEDNNVYSSDFGLKTQDYYVASFANEDNLVIWRGVLNSDGEIVNVSYNWEGYDFSFADKEDISYYAENNPILNKSAVNSIKAELVNLNFFSDQLMAWKWVVILKEPVPTKSGDRQVFFVSPRVFGSNNADRLHLTASTIPKDDADDSRLSTFATTEEEQRYLSDLNSETGYNRSSYSRVGEYNQRPESYNTVNLD